MATLDLTTRTIYDGVYQSTEDVTIGSEIIDLVHSTEPLGRAKADQWVAKAASLAAASTTFDLRETAANLTDKFGTAISLQKLVGIGVRNKTATTGKILTVSGTALQNVLGGTAPTVKIGPKGFFKWESPVDGAALTDGTGDELTLDPGTDTIDYEVILYGLAA